MTDHAPDRIWSGIDIPKTIAGVLAAVSAAVLGSFLGVAGTLAGAAVASIVGSVGTEIYHRWIDRGSKKIKSTFVTAPAAVGTPAVAAAEEETPSEEAPPRPPAKLHWGRVAAVAGAVFVLAMGALTAFELLTHQSVADAVGNRSSSSTTLGSVLSGNDSGKSRTPATTPSESAPATEESPAETATTEPATEPSKTTEPTEPTATVEPTEPATTEGPAGQTHQPDGGTQPGNENAPAGGGK